MSQTLTDPEETRLSIRASEPDKTLLAQAARSVLAEQTEFGLTPEQWEAFCRRLDALPQSIPALNRLFAQPEPFDA